MKVNYIIILLVLLVSAINAAIITGDGIPNPPSYYQRFRRSEYPASHPFYQWWYFTIKDLEHGEHFAFTYAYSESKNTTTSGAYLMVIHFDQQKVVDTSNSLFLSSQ